MLSAGVVKGLLAGVLLMSILWAVPIVAASSGAKDKPDYYYFEEDWIAVPAQPSANLAVVSFPKGSSILSVEDKGKLRNTMTSVGKNGAIKEAYIAAYADDVRQGTSDLSVEAQRLARQRARAISNYLEDDFGIDTITFNMAARPGWWARLWNTENAKVKEAGNTSQDWVASLLRTHSQPSTASVVFTTRNRPKIGE